MKIPVAIALLFLIFAAGFAGCDKLAAREEDLVDPRNDTTDTGSPAIDVEPDPDTATKPSTDTGDAATADTPESSDDTSAQAACGDGAVVVPEECDDGNHVLSDACPDGPEGTCRAATCGDGFVAEGSEACDGNAAPNATCDDACALLCAAGFADCNQAPSDGCEAELASAPEHCSVCGHGCGGAECISGYCQPILMWFGFSEGESTASNSLAINGNYVYYTGSYEDWPAFDPLYSLWTLSRLPKTATDITGTGNSFWSSQSKAWRLRFDDTHAYWLDSVDEVEPPWPGLADARALKHMSTDRTGSAIDFDVKATGVFDFVVDDEHVYWSHPDSKTIVRIDKTTRVHEAFVEGLDGPRTLAQDADYLYYLDWSEADSTVRLWRAAKAGGTAPQLLAETTGLPSSFYLGLDQIIVDEDTLFWLNPRHAQGTGPTGLVAAIVSVPLGGGPIEVVKVFSYIHGAGFDIDDEYVYWSTPEWVDAGRSSGVISRIARDGSGESVVISEATAWSFSGSCSSSVCPHLDWYHGFPSPRGIAVDEQFVYWLDEYSSVLRVAK